jgi:hypothetical protein
MHVDRLFGGVSMPVHNQLQARSAVLGGVIAGAIAGLALLPLNVIGAFLRGQSALASLKFPGAWLLGERAMRPDFDFIALYVGLGTHYAVAIAWGVAFALLFYGLGRAMTVVAGLGWGIVVWAAMFYLVLPVAGLGDAARSAPVLPSLLQHLFFGAVLALGFLPFQRELPRGLFRGDVARHA